MTLRPNQLVASDLSFIADSAAARVVGIRVLIDIVGNVIVFIPLGVCLALALRRLPACRQGFVTILVGASFSLIIEVVQAGMTDRVAQMGDWLLNSFGVAVGAVSATWLSVRSRSQIREG
jgi:glycopeptide antibiotics resistance protein